MMSTNEDAREPLSSRDLILWALTLPPFGGQKTRLLTPSEIHTHCGEHLSRERTYYFDSPGDPVYHGVGA